MTDFAVAISADDQAAADLLVARVRSEWVGDYECFLNIRPEASSDGDDPRFTKLYRNLHAIEGLRKACDAASRAHAPWTVHVRAGDPWLSLQRVRELGAIMSQRHKVFAARGVGFGYYAHDCPVGQFDDAFFFFDNTFARDGGLWEFRARDLLPHKLAIHGFLALWILARVGIRHFWHYAEHVPLETTATAPRGALRRWYNEHVLRRWMYRYHYGDMLWPRPLSEFYPPSLCHE